MDAMIKAGIYFIINLYTGMIYVGSAINFKERRLGSVETDRCKKRIFIKIDTSPSGVLLAYPHLHVLSKKRIDYAVIKRPLVKNAILFIY